MAIPDSDACANKSAGTSGKAWVSLVLGLFSISCSILSILSRVAWASLEEGVISIGSIIFIGIPAIILGIRSFRDIGASRGRLKGRGVAVAGIMASVMGMLVAAYIAILLPPSLQNRRELAPRIFSGNNLHQIALAMHNYNAAYGSLPPDNFKGKEHVANYGQPGLSWRVALLPFLGGDKEDALYKEFHLDEPWDSPHNKTLLARMPKVYAHPGGDADKTAAGFSYYRVFVGPGTAFDPTEEHKIRLLEDFSDGTANTLLVVEAADPTEWTRPETEDFVYSPTKPLPRLGGVWKSGFNVGLADGSVRHAQNDISETTLRALITRNGNDVVGPDF